MTIRRVDKDSTDPSPDGSTWAKAYPYLQDAITASATNDEIWVADGTYKPSKTGDRNEYFNLKSYLKLYGGFNGTETTREERDWETNVTILSGDLNGDDLPNFVNRSDNSYWICKCANYTYNHIVDGFTIRGANTTGDTGGGVYLTHASGSSIKNCIFESNEATYGSSVSAISNSSGILIDSCEFNDNRTASHGGAVWVYNSRAFVSNCSFTANVSGGHGGAISFYGFYSSYSTLSNSTFTSNTASTYGGCISVIASAKAVVTNCDFISGSANYGGAFMCLTDASVDFTDCDFIGNTALLRGGVSYIGQTAANMTFSNCNYIENYCDQAGCVASVHYFASTGAYTITIQGCTFRGNYNTLGEGGNYINGSANVNIEDSYFYNNTAATYGGCLSLVYDCAPRISRCVFAGNTAQYGGALRFYGPCKATFEDCIFSGNHSTSQGGAVFSHYSNIHPVFVRCAFVGNSATSGGAIYLRDNNAATFESCLFVGNISSVSGGGCYVLTYCGINLINCSGIKNKATANGGFLYAQRGDAVLRNTVVWGNEAATDGSGKGIYSVYPGSTAEGVDIDYCDFQGGLSGSGTSGIRVLTGAVLTDGGNNINSDPIWSESVTSTWTDDAVYDGDTGKTTLTKTGANWSSNQFQGLFLNPLTSQTKYFYIESNTADTIVVWGNASVALEGDTFQVSDFRLRDVSPCRDAGVLGVVEYSATDLAGLPRLQNNTIDMGCYEHVLQGTTLHREGVNVETQSINPTVVISGSGLVKPLDDSCVSSWETNTGGVVVCVDTDTSDRYPWLAIKTATDVYYRELFAL